MPRLRTGVWSGPRECVARERARSECSGGGIARRAHEWQAIVDVARQLDGVQQVEIKCDVANTRSAAIPRRLGFRLDRTEPREPAAAGETGSDQVWALDLSSSA